MANSPKLLTGKQVAEQLGLTSERTIRSLRETGKLAFIKVAGRYMYPCDAVDQFIQDNTVMPCQDNTQGQNLSLINVAVEPSTSTTLKTDAATKKARGRAISEKLKKLSQTTSEAKPEEAGHVIRGPSNHRRP